MEIYAGVNSVFMANLRMGMAMAMGMGIPKSESKSGSSSQSKTRPESRIQNPGSRVRVAGALISTLGHWRWTTGEQIGLLHFISGVG